MLKRLCKDRTCIITRGYTRTLSGINELANFAFQDCPSLHEEDISICIFGGDSMAQYLGLIFTAPPNWTIPASYTTVTEFEPFIA